MVHSLPRALFPILLLQVPMWGSDSFEVSGPSEPIVAMLGTEAVLPCYVTATVDMKNVELRWFRSQYLEAVYVYQDGMEQAAEQLVDYKGRVELLKDYISEGRVAVRIHNLRVSDNGMYRCFFKQNDNFGEATLELKVISLGSGPRIIMVGPEDEGIKLSCTGKGWFPQPEVQWKDENGEKIPSLSEQETQDDDGLFQMDAFLILRDRTKGKVSCSMKNSFLLQEQTDTISIPEPFFPRTSPWKAAFVVTFLMLVVCLSAAVFFAWREKQEKKKSKKVRDAKQKEVTEKEVIKKELERRKNLYLLDWRKAKLYADWRKEKFEAADVSLDPITAHPKLKISENGRHASLEEEDYETKFSVLGHDYFTTGKYYWEVEVNKETEMKSGTRWALGICSATVERKGWFAESTDKDFWVLAYKEGIVMALTTKPESLPLRHYPERIGIFLDLKNGDVSFYNMMDGSHIYSFSGNFHGNIHPYFSLQGVGTSMSICSTSGQNENVPSSSSGMSVTQPRNCDTDAPEETNTLLSP
ncbi:butyrophilin subfamily 1 member A1-like [Ochotona curzoniae]|uniref:butyrophilin subfamily 1 member A1-like n=1 Tax=Ochotona curzoniae TaxID=130825 RepID=UPI001B34E588|nr:butyrophilin subfamily 1 member A1-like [Ochotona curzoniae]